MAELAYAVAASILEKLGSVAYQELSLAWGMKNDLNKLKDKTLILQSVLKDAEKKQTRDQLLRKWLVRVKQVFNDAVDVLDEFDCEILRRQVVKEYGSVGRKVRRFFSGSNPAAFRFSIVQKVREIRVTLDDIAKDMANFKLISAQLGGEEGPSHWIDQQLLKDRMTHSFVDDSDVIGRESDKARIINMLMRPNDDNLYVVPIVGIGGLGKTTLAKSIYNDEHIRASFEVKIWVCVSLDFDVTRIVREILTSAKREEDFSKMSIDNLQTSLRSILEGKRFLIVLDDLWNEDRIKWLDLRSFLTAGAKGSKVIVTTRTTLVSSIMTRSPPHLLEGLSKENSRFLFFKCAFGDEKRAGKSPGLEDIGKEIVKKCGGVPLALKTLGCLLYSKVEAEWIRVRDNEIWELERDDGRILPALRLSYITMDPRLKQCFAFCSTFEKDAELLSLDLISIWMALGILESPNEQIDLEDFGEFQFNELCARAFFQCRYHGKRWFNYSCDMHDLIHDLACSITESECCIIKSGRENITDSVRHLRIFLNKHNLLVLKNLKKLLSIYVDCTSKECEIDEFFLSLSDKQYRYLRVFDLQNAPCEVLPSSIGTLKHLRYLNLSGSDIKRLPDSICDLQSLQTLLLHNCRELEELPTNMKKLVTLRTLSVTTKQEYFPENGIGHLKSLRTLIILLCSNLRSLPNDIKYCTTLRSLVIHECRLLDLANEVDEIVILLNLETFLVDDLPHTTALPNWLRGASNSLKHLVIKSCQQLVTLAEWVPNFVALEKLVVVDSEKLHFESRHDGSIPLKIQRVTLLYLPKATALPKWLGGASKSLQHLKIENCPGLFALPDWLSNCVSLNTLHIVQCKQLLALPQGMQRLTSLTDLKIRFCEKLELACDPNEVLQLSLRRFVIQGVGMRGLPEWLQGAAHRLEELYISGCPQFTALPKWLPDFISLKSIIISGCPQFSSLPERMSRLTSLTHLHIIGPSDEFCKRYKPQTGENWENIAHIPNVKFD